MKNNINVVAFSIITMNFIVAIRQISIAVTSIICFTILIMKNKGLWGFLILVVGLIVHFIDVHLYNEHEKKTTNSYISPRI